MHHFEFRLSFVLNILYLAQNRFHSRYSFGYGILLYIRKTPHFRPFAAYFGGFVGIFYYKTDKSAILCPGKTEVADFVSFKGSIVQGVIPLDKLEFVCYAWKGHLFPIH